MEFKTLFIIICVEPIQLSLKLKDVLILLWNYLPVNDSLFMKMFQGQHYFRQVEAACNRNAVFSLSIRSTY